MPAGGAGGPLIAKSGLASSSATAAAAPVCADGIDEGAALQKSLRSARVLHRFNFV